MADTMAEALLESLEDLGGIRTKDEITAWFAQHYNGTWAPGTLRDHLYGGRVNHPLAYRHHPGQRKFLFDHGNHRYEIYSEQKHGRFNNGMPVSAADAPGWILIHSSKPTDYGPDAEHPSPMAQLEQEDAEHRNDLHWHWKMRRPPKEGTALKRLLLAWKGEVFGEALAQVTHDSELRGYNFAFILHNYWPVVPPIPFDQLRLGSRAKNHRGLIRLNDRVIAAFEAKRAKRRRRNSSADVTEAELDIDQIVNPQKRAKEARRGLFASMEVRKCIEEHAMTVARAHLEKERFHSIKNTSKGNPFDYKASKAGRTYIVEVKGTIGDGSEVIITRNEVRRHREHHPNNILIVVHSIKLDRSQKNPVASEGVAVMTDEWFIEEDRLSPLSYTYRT